MLAPRRSVRRLLLVSHVSVIVVVALVGFATVRLLTPTLFERRMQGLGGYGFGRNRAGTNPFADATAVSESLDRSLSIGAAVAAAVGIVVALVAGWWLSRGLVGRLSALVATTHEIADGKHEARVEVPAEVELADLAHSINRLGSSLEETDRTRAGMISDLAHEIRNPLTTIQGSMEGLIDGVIDPTPETFASVAEEADRLRRLTEDLSLLARSQEGALALRAERFDLGALVATAVERFAVPAELAEVDLVVETDAVTVEGDPDRLVQVVTNLVGNALTHTPSGGTITVRVGRHGPQAVLDVIDTGSGIPADQLSTVFERYTRLDHQRPGTGIGLNIARNLIRAHGGTITATSAGSGAGTRFSAELPVAAD